MFCSRDLQNQTNDSNKLHYFDKLKMILSRNIIRSITVDPSWAGENQRKMDGTCKHEKP